MVDRNPRKMCPRCEQYRTLGTFGVFTECGPCRRQQDRLAAENRPGAQLSYRTRKKAHLQEVNRRTKFGVTPEDFARMNDQQDGRCAICGDPPRRRAINVDHNHDTGEVRGLLCTPCNAAIGLLKDDPERMRAAIAYLADPPARRLHL